ncbi:undecaprenyl-diphosphate phosphatase [Pseudoxanthomonas kalamensis DSM 18571]|uniref:undecaprenyl-diphosphate phosphatase n=1 Tax=Pseudoxanthomonas kalamensis TaxID=289483 RepID=UPI0013920968|nr:undecaprenyl-diphosphate phosphatase [Pseudoxanthomonas kalamensis]KAF1712452.1 undecaprenyl-diphosphate phosphatase [Pseudoxanthomonas kalamensis DSM 18571]
MTDLLSALLLGIIEGLTEFLPISSTGHLLIAERWLGHRSDLFNIGIQAGAILAVVLIYRQRLWRLLTGFGQPGNRDYALKLAAAFGVTAVLGLVVKKLGFELPDEITPVAWALVLGGIWMLAAEHFAAKRAAALGERATITWTVALLVGIAQVVAGVFPGTSRSGATIFVALLAGTTSRAAATEFAFLVGIPTMFAATAYELIDVVGSGQAAEEDWASFAVAFAASAVTAFVSVKWLLHYIQSHRFTPFAIYRMAFGALLLLWIPAGA